MPQRRRSGKSLRKPRSRGRKKAAKSLPQGDLLGARPRAAQSILRQGEAAISPAPSYSADKIVALRETFNVSQPVFAAALNVSSETIKKWEQGTREPDGASTRLLELVETHPNWILDALQLTRPSVRPKLSPVKADRRRPEGVDR